MSHTNRGLALSMYLGFAVVAGFIFLSYATALRKVEPMSLEASFSSDFNNDSRSRLELDIQNTKKKIDDRVATITRRASQASQRVQGVGQSISNSIQWLNQSIESLSEKLEKISEKLENTEDNALVEAEIKRAFREAFLGESEPSADPVDEAEVTPDSHAFEKLADASDLKTTQDIDVPILGNDVPSWISQRVVEENRISVPIESSLHATLDECRSELASRLPTEVKKIVEDHVLKQISADDIPGLTPEYIKEKLIDSSVEFDNYQERPSGNFHQLWVKLNINKKELQRIREWEREVLSTTRVWMLGGLSLAFLGSFAGLSEVFKFLSIRDQNRRGSRPIA